MRQFLLHIFTAVVIFSCNQKPSDPVQENAPESVVREFEKAKVFTTAKDTDLRLTNTEDPTFDQGEQPLETQLSIFVNPSKTFQTFVGIGGAITDASAETFAKLPKEKQDELIQAYYSEEGIGYTLVRTHIHSCDFSSGSYTYIEDGDESLESFDVSHDLKFRIPISKKRLQQQEVRYLHT